MRTLKPRFKSTSRRICASCSVTRLSGVPSRKVMPEETAMDSTAPRWFVPPVTFGLPSGCESVLTRSPPLVPCPAFTQTTLSPYLPLVFL